MPIWQYTQQFLYSILDLWVEAAPWLLLGLVSAGLIKAFLPASLINRWLGGRGPWPILKAALLGTPLPLCSCSVLPAAVTLRRSGASKGSTVSFLIATPENGFDSIALSYALLGPFMTIVRPLAAISSALFTGLLTELLSHFSSSTAIAPPSPSPTATCCSCNGNAETSHPATPPSFSRKLQTGLKYAVTDLFVDIILWLILGLILAAAVTTFLPPSTLAQWGSGLPAMFAMLLIGIPMYICATASTPLAASLLLAGISPGTVLVFLLAGPATNLATMGIIRKELGSIPLMAYLLGITITTLAAGLLTDFLVSRMNINIIAQTSHAAHILPHSISIAAAILLVLLALYPLRCLFRSANSHSCP